MRIVPTRNPWMTLDEISRWSGRPTAWWRKRLGKIPHIKDGIIMVKFSDVEAYLNAHKVDPKPGGTK